jgi:hypothetical protein|tara:strand:- start:221 stop:601 length:381 start_codon:yes stop_codon:yes gene_type:complete
MEEPNPPHLIVMRIQMMTFDEGHGTAELIIDRRSSFGRSERRVTTIDARSEEEREIDGDRRKVERRRQIDPTTCERDYSQEEVEFMSAMDDYKRRSGRQFPTWSEVLEVLRSMGYRQVAEPTEIEL